MSHKTHAAPHRHAWRDLGRNTKAGWRYRCDVCGSKSRNPHSQEPPFREPLRIRSAVLIGPHAGLSWTWEAGRDEAATTPAHEEAHTNG